MKSCDTCKWYKGYGRRWSGIFREDRCNNKKLKYGFCKINRMDETQCGKTGKHWELNAPEKSFWRSLLG